MRDLRSFLKSKFEASGGSLSFEAFMALALYDSDFGYYGANISDVGNGRGDFATSATLSSGLGNAIGRWIQAEIDELGWDGPVSIIEVGPGSGSLAAEVLKQFGWWGRRKLDYHLVEVSPVLRGRQKKRLRGRRVSWHTSIKGALEKANGRALIYSNELFDAFPAKWLRSTGEPNQWEKFASVTMRLTVSKSFGASCLIRSIRRVSLRWDCRGWNRGVALRFSLR